MAPVTPVSVRWIWSVGSAAMPVAARADRAISEALALYKEETKSASNPSGTTLAPGDPRRLHMQVLITLLVQQRGNIDFAGKQSLLRFVSDEWIDELAALWGEERLPAAASECTQRFTFSDAGAHTVPAGTRVTDGTNLWEVIEDKVAG